MVCSRRVTPTAMTRMLVLRCAKPQAGVFIGSPLRTPFVEQGTYTPSAWMMMLTHTCTAPNPVLRVGNFC